MPQIQKRIQTTDPSLVDLQGDTGFCLYPGDSRGSGLDFSAFLDGEEHAGQSARSTSTSSYAFKPLDAPNGSVTVRLEYRRGVDSKVGRYCVLCVTGECHVQRINRGHTRGVFFFAASFQFPVGTFLCCST